MLQFTPILRGFLNSLKHLSICTALLVCGCQNRAPSLRMLDARANYNADMDDEEVALYQRTRNRPDSITKRIAPRIAKVYIYPHELPSRDYFWGGYVSLVITPDEWSFEQLDDVSTSSESKAAIQELK